MVPFLGSAASTFKPLRFLSFLVATLSLVSCGPDSESQLADSRTQKSSAIVQQPPAGEKTVYIVDTLIGAVYPILARTRAEDLLAYPSTGACTTDLVEIDSDEGICKAPFAFKRPCYERDAFCGRDTSRCLNPKTCQVFQNRYDTPRTAVATFPPAVEQYECNCGMRCSWDGPPSETCDEKRWFCDTCERLVEPERCVRFYNDFVSNILDPMHLDQRNYQYVKKRRSYDINTGVCSVSVEPPVVADEANFVVCGCVGDGGDLSGYDYSECNVPAPLCDQLRPWEFSAPNQTKSTIPDCSSSLCRDAYEGYPGASCLSCEHIPMSSTTGTNVRAKYGCLQNSMRLLDEPGFPAVSRADVEAVIDRQKRLVFELKGGDLDGSQFADAVATYLKGPTQEWECGNVVNLPQVPADCGARSVQGAIELCQRLRDTSYTDTIMVSRALETCIAAAEALGGGPLSTARCNAEQHRDLLRLINYQLLSRQLEQITNDPTDTGRLERQLGLISRWYETALAAHAGRETLEADLTSLLAELWRRAYSDVFAPIEAKLAAGTLSAADVTGVRTEAQKREQKVLQAALDGNVRGAPLLLILADALQPTAERLDDLSVFHDFACFFAPEACPGAPPKKPEGGCPAKIEESRYKKVVPQLWWILATLDTTELAAAVAVNNEEMSDLNGWKPVMQSLAAHQDALLEAIAAVPGFYQESVGALPSHAMPLAELLRIAKARQASYQCSGQFLSSANRNILNTRMTHQRRKEIGIYMGVVKDRLAQAKVLYRDELDTLIRGLASQLRDEGQQEQMQAELEALLAQHDDLAADLAGLDANHNEQQRLSGSLLRNFAALDAPAATNQYLTPQDVVPSQKALHMTFSGRTKGGRFTGIVRAPSALAVYAPITDLKPGEAVVVEASGRYSPTCALSTARVLPPSGLPEISQIVASTTGPEGYALGWDGEKYTAKDVSDSESETDSFAYGVRGQVCVGGGAFGASASACAFVEVSHSDASTRTKTDASGSRQRTSASFSSGLRLSTTPFRDAPVGALLAVLTKKDTAAIIDVNVVQAPYTQILIPTEPDTAVDLYFIVNDRQCDTADDASELSLKVERYLGKNDVVKAALEAMTEALQDLDRKESLLVAQGRLLPHEIDAEHTAARSHVDAALLRYRITAGFSALDIPLQALFDNFVLQQIVKLERAVEVQTIERQLESIRLKARGLSEAIRRNQGAARLEVLVPRRAMRNLMGAHCEACGLSGTLRQRSEEAMRMVRDYFYPLLELWYPHTLFGLKQEATFNEALDELRGVDLDSDALTITQDIIDVLEAALVKYNDDMFFGYQDEEIEEQPKIVVSFPKPGSGPTPFSSGDSLFRTADAVDSAAVWEAARGGKVGGFTVRPEYVYSEIGGINGVLDCSHNLPIVENMVLYLVHSYPVKYWEGSFLPMSVSRTQMFAAASDPLIYQVRAFDEHIDPTASGPLDFVVDIMEGASGLGPGGPIKRFEDEWRQHWRTIGMSPFTTFYVNFAGLYAGAHTQGSDPLETLGVSEILLVMEVDITPGADNDWVAPCKQ